MLNIIQMFHVCFWLHCSTSDGKRTARLRISLLVVVHSEGVDELVHQVARDFFSPIPKTALRASAYKNTRIIPFLLNSGALVRNRYSYEIAGKGSIFYSAYQLQTDFVCLYRGNIFTTQFLHIYGFVLEKKTIKSFENTLLTDSYNFLPSPINPPRFR